MTDHFLYLDETGSVDFNPASGDYFSIGSALFSGDPSQAIWRGHLLRAELESRNVNLPKGFHAVHDSQRTRGEVFSLIGELPPGRIDATHLLKENAYDSIRSAGKPRLYKMALYLHLKYVMPQVAKAGDRVFVIAGTIHLTKGTTSAAKGALEDICRQLSGGATVVPCLWEARSSWGIQVADYCMWALQRDMDGKACQWFPEVVEPLLVSNFFPWGSAEAQEDRLSR